MKRNSKEVFELEKYQVKNVALLRGRMQGKVNGMCRAIKGH